jgi:aspartate racemase
MSEVCVEEMSSRDRVRDVRLGVIGGVGPVATTEFYRLLVAEVRNKAKGASPDLVIHSLPMPADLEYAVLAGTLTSRDEARITQLLSDALDVLERAGCRLVAMPCNSFHNFLRPLLADRSLTLIDMVRETIGRAADQGLHRLTLLATGTSLDGEAYAHSTLRGVEVVLPARQHVIVELLERCVTGSGHSMDLTAIRDALQEGGRSHGVLLGCTDLTVIRDELAEVMPVVDSLSCLVEACAEALMTVADEDRLLV